MLPSQTTLSFAGCQWTWRSFQQECSGGGCWNLTEICRRFQAIKKEMEALSHVQDVGQASSHTRNCTEFLPRIMEAIGQPNSWWSEAQKWKTVSSAWSMNWRGALLRDSRGKGCVLCVLGEHILGQLEVHHDICCVCRMLRMFPADLESLLQMYDHESLWLRSKCSTSWIQTWHTHSHTNYNI